MTSGRSTVGGLMLAVAVAAANTAALRLVLRDPLNGSLILPLGWIALQVGGHRAWRGRGGVRAYWSGFVAAGIVSLIAPLIALWLFPQSWACSAVKAYYGAVVDGLNRLAWLLVVHRGPAAHRAWGTGSKCVLALALYLPQLLVAIAGGWAVRWVSRAYVEGRPRQVSRLQPGDGRRVEP